MEMLVSENTYHSAVDTFHTCASLGNNCNINCVSKHLMGTFNIKLMGVLSGNQYQERLQKFI